MRTHREHRVRGKFGDTWGHWSSGLGLYCREEATSQQQNAPNTPATGGPGITGLPLAGETLTATTDSIADEDGLTGTTFTYQWVRSDLATITDEDIEGADGETYTLTAQDAGKALKVRVTFTDDAGNEESMTSYAVIAAPPVVNPDEDEAEEQEENSPPTGEPGIEGTLQVDETLTAATTGIADDDGLTSAAFAYQCIRKDGTTETDIDQATDSTHTLTGADLDKTIKVRVTFTDDAGNEESLTSAATAAVKPPLTATVHDAPASHDGENVFTFELRFSESPSGGYVTLQDHAFTVTGGGVTQARRLERLANVRWEISMDSTSNAKVTVSLPSTADCEAVGAICTADDRMLSGSLEFTVNGPPSQQQSSDDDQNGQDDGTAESPPSAPTGLTATVNGNGSITLTWDDPGDDTITGYLILRRRPAEGERTLQVYVADTGSAAAYTDTGVTAGTQHTYRIKAINSAGTGPRSGYVNVDQ